MNAAQFNEAIEGALKPYVSRWRLLVRLLRDAGD
jgi:hypothetical protein